MRKLMLAIAEVSSDFRVTVVSTEYSKQRVNLDELVGKKKEEHTVATVAKGYPFLCRGKVWVRAQSWSQTSPRGA